MELSTICIGNRPPLRHHQVHRYAVALSLSSTLPNLQSETLETLEWNRVCIHLSSFTSTSMGLVSAQSSSIPMGRTLDESQRLLDQTTAALGLARTIDFSGVEDVSEIVRCCVSGEVATIGEICRVKGTLRAARRVVEQLEEMVDEDGDDDKERINHLLEILQDCDFLTDLEQKIEFCIDCNFSFVLDRASDDLEIIRSERKTNMEILDSLLKSISQKIFQSGGIDKPLVTNRRSRMCVAVKATHRSLLPGAVVLDTSSSGATYFTEPKEAMDLNNRDVRLANMEKNEERAILSLLTSELAGSANEIVRLLDGIEILDIAVARARYAKWINGSCPILEDSDAYEGSLSVDVCGVQHPLLLGSHLSGLNDESEPGFPVPIDIKTRRGTNVVIISGPNAGGKTASMKTLGLVSLMSKAGMYLPARNSPRIPWFDLVLADIGDHQSLEQSLSTFSGHLVRICKILEVSTKNSLVLIDEIGSGTDPSEGVALSSSILQELKDRVRLAVVTTHYTDLTRLSETDARFENAAMGFSLETLKPTYQIFWGSTGESHALKIARRVGFDEKVIDRAEGWLEQFVPEKLEERKGRLYRSLVEGRERLESEARRARAFHGDVMELYHEIKDEAQDLDIREAALFAKETEQVQEELKVIKSKIESIVQEFEDQMVSTDVDHLGSLVKKAESDIGSILKNQRPRSNLARGGPGQGSYVPKLGERVRVKQFGGKVGEVIEVCEDDGSVVVQQGKMKFRVEKSGVQGLSEANGVARKAPDMKKKKAHSLRNLRNLLEKKGEEEVSYGPLVQTSKNTVDLRGMRVEEASRTVEMAIDSRESGSILFIVHGMGTGVVKDRAVEILKKHPRIHRFEQESPLNFGCTVAFIK